MRAFLAKRGLYRTDLAALGLLLVCLASGLRERDDIRTRTLMRWLDQVRAQGVAPDRMITLFRSADGEPLPFFDAAVWSGTSPRSWRSLASGFQSSGALAYRSDLEDFWGNPWIAVVTADDRRHLQVVSSGPDGQFEWDYGDDLKVWPAWSGRVRAHSPWDRWQASTTCVSFVVLPYLGLRVALQRRSPQVWLEALSALAMAIGPSCALAIVLFGTTVTDASLPASSPVLVVAPRTAVLLSAFAVLWGAAFAWRLRRPRRAVTG